MHDIYVERRTLRGATKLSQDIAAHLYTRPYDSKTIVLTDRPHDLMSVVIKHWRKIERQVQRQRSSTIDPFRKMELTEELARMQQLYFSLKPEHYQTDKSVSFANASLAFDLPTTCNTLYVARPATEDALTLLGCWVQHHGLLVAYDV